jgi:Ser/Thr protein kinase RdoA (MazF antagonist)
MKLLPKPVLAELSSRYGTRPQDLSFLGGGQDWSDGTVYRYHGTEEERALKIISFPRTDSEALARAKRRLAIIDLFSRGGAPLAGPLSSPEGNRFETVEADGELFLAYSSRLVPGREVRPHDPCAHSGAFQKAVGEAVGLLHALSEARGLRAGMDGRCEADAPLQGWCDEWAFFRRWCRDDEVGEAWERLRERIEALPMDSSRYGFVHNDIHAFNFIFDPDAEPARSGGEPSLTLIDFDVSGWHFYACDAAQALYSFGIMATGGPETGRPLPAGFWPWAKALFLEGYSRHRDPGLIKDGLDLWLQYRRCLMFMPFQEETAKRPEWRAAWKRAIAEGEEALA